MSIATEISRLQTAKSDLKTAINAKLSTGLIADETIDEYAGFVDNIEAGGGGTEIISSLVNTADYTDDLVIPEGVTEIRRYCFYQGAKFKGGLVLPNSLSVIGENAFVFCNFQGTLTLPNNLTEIQGSAFYGCKFTGTLTIPAGTTFFVYDSQFRSCSGFTKVVFAGQASTIRDYCFADCTSVLEYDFTNCTSVPTLSNVNAFNGINAICKIYVPAALYDTWIAATNWSTYASYIVAV